MFEPFDAKALGVVWVAVTAALGFLGRQGVATTVRHAGSDPYDRRFKRAVQVAAWAWLGLTLVLVAALLRPAVVDPGARWIMVITLTIVVSILGVILAKRLARRRFALRSNTTGANRWQPPPH